MKAREILRDLCIFVGVLFIAWGFIHWQSFEFNKDEGLVVGGGIETGEIPAGSILWSHLTASKDMDTKIISAGNRRIDVVANDTSQDSHLAARGIGKDVTVYGVAYMNTRYYIVVDVPPEKVIDYSEADVSYKLECFIWTPNYFMFILGSLLIFAGIIAKREKIEVPAAPPIAQVPAIMPEQPIAPIAPPIPIAKPVEEKKEVVGRVKCVGCGEIIPLYTKERPLRISCPSCKREGTLR
ncbi:MAG: hypothetical protein AB1779_09510 [Candidatus Thermoplasmatota archaeon]